MTALPTASANVRGKARPFNASGMAHILPEPRRSRD
jgi:hypothetical protein